MRRSDLTTIVDRFLKVRVTGTAGMAVWAMAVLGLSLEGGVVAAGQPTHALVTFGGQSSARGQGLLVLRLNACYAITASHVMGERTIASLIGGDGRGLLGEGRLLVKFEKEDVALLRVTGALVHGCGGGMEKTHRLDGVLSRRTRAELSFVVDDGGIGRIPLVVTDIGPEFLRVLPTRPVDSFWQGLSGSLVTVSDEPVGILVSVNRDGQGKAIRYDRALQRVREFFATPSRAGASPSLPRVPLSQRRDLKGVDLLAAANGGAVVRWSALPLRPENGASNLIEDGNHMWTVVAREYPIEVDFELAEGQVHTVGRIELLSDGVYPSGRVPRDIEILFGVEDPRSWLSLVSGTVFPHEASAVFKFAPVRSRQ